MRAGAKQQAQRAQRGAQHCALSALQETPSCAQEGVRSCAANRSMRSSETAQQRTHHS
jgi:hypothetical protein